MLLFNSKDHVFHAKEHKVKYNNVPTSDGMATKFRRLSSVGTGGVADHKIPSAPHLNLPPPPISSIPF